MFIESMYENVFQTTVKFTTGIFKCSDQSNCYFIMPLNTVFGPKKQKKKKKKKERKKEIPSTKPMIYYPLRRYKFIYWQL